MDFQIDYLESEKMSRSLAEYQRFNYYLKEGKYGHNVYAADSTTTIEIKSLTLLKIEKFSVVYKALEDAKSTRGTINKMKELNKERDEELKELKQFLSDTKLDSKSAVYKLVKEQVGNLIVDIPWYGKLIRE